MHEKYIRNGSQSYLRGWNENEEARIQREVRETSRELERVNQS